MSATITPSMEAAIRQDIRKAVINDKANACPIIVRLAWHASGTFDKSNGTGGSDGATMRFSPEKDDGANAGLSIPRDMLHAVKVKYPDISYADLWTMAGCAAIEWAGGPSVPHAMGRTDDADNSKCPMNGRLPDANLGAQHLRDVFYRMGFNDREIVALSGAHTLGRCHLVRSGFDGPWTENPLDFDNSYFQVLLNKQWRKKEWDGPMQYEDVQTGSLMMLPTDMALVQDKEFLPFVELYAKDQKQFFADFSAAFSKLIHLGCPHKPAPKASSKTPSSQFREAAMHGSLGPVKALSASADVHEVEANTKRSALHKAAFWGHEGTVAFLVDDLKLSMDSQDSNGDTPLHDAARFGHEKVVKVLLEGGANISIKNNDNKDALELAVDYEKPEIVELIKAKMSKM